MILNSEKDCLFSVTVDIGSQHKSEKFNILNDDHLQVNLNFIELLLDC